MHILILSVEKGYGIFGVFSAFRFDFFLIAGNDQSRKMFFSFLTASL